MASVHKRPDSKYWHAFFRNSEGRLIDRSTRLTDRKKALKVAEELEAMVQRKKNSAVVKATFRELFEETFGEALPVTTLGSFSVQSPKTQRSSSIFDTVSEFR